ncbi:glycogen synthase GlgA [Psychromarinibacter sp. C21-152]|uniref:Glycogen synthase n=1 Tax=Psychromarinibacter sediminicola TaxID=3033385 RepID=A0AAE3NRX1_9RHOB|nr:glycogen synthase GlgA [Psychromarinibacter sediminicola]MDF0601354.1 glycogen synthase GlgA [Psychromarinibacter sediminicola]
MVRPVLSVASECVPLLKTGGLADVVGALPRAMAEQGWHMRVLMPAYPGLTKTLGKAKTLWSAEDLFGGPARVLAGAVSGIEVLLLDAPHLYDRKGGPYSDDSGDFPDNPERFAALSWVAAEIAKDGLSDGWRPEVVHCHDWQAGFAPAYIRYAGIADVRSVLTIHNIAFQGHAPRDRMAALRLPEEEFTQDGLEYWGNLSSLKAGLVTADAITTVSPTYANELMRGAYGLGLEGVIAARASDLHGILDGVDVQVWSPEADPAIHPYTSRALGEKAKNRAALLKEFGLGEVPGPLAIVVSRLTTQKGLDLIPSCLSEFTWRGGGLIVLGSGDPQIEMAFRHEATLNPPRVAVRIGYDEALSHRMFAGGDAVLVPSRFEPCGLTQMYGLRYGTVPLVAATGGLNDTVIDANPAALDAGVATGVVFHPTDRLALEQALRRLVTLHSDSRTWRQMQRNGMKAQLDWSRASAAYAGLYEGLFE